MRFQQFALDGNSTVDRRLRRTLLGCGRCRPHKGENATFSKRGPQKPRYKDVRGR